MTAPCLAIAAAGGGYEFRNVAIGGGGFVSGLVFHPGQAGLVYARTDVGGAYRWDVSARRWIALTDWIGADDVNLTGIESLAVDPSDSSRVYLAAGTYTFEQAGNGAILRSRDRGATFERSDLPFKLGANELGRGNGERLAVDPNDGRVLFFGSRGDGLWRSADQGASWSRVESFPAVATSQAATAENSWRRQPIGIVFVAFEPASGRRGEPTPTLYAGVSTRETSLFVSRDGGKIWNPVAGQPTGLRPNHMVRGADGIWYLSYGDEPGPDNMRNGAVWKYSPENGAWTEITPAPQSSDTQKDGFGWGAVAVDAQNPKLLLASTFCRYGPHDDIFRSSDGGRSWAPLFDRSRFDHSSNMWTREHSPHWIADVEIDPHDSDHALFVTGYGIWGTRNLRAADRNGSVDWQFDNAGLEETVALGLISPPRGAPLLSAMGDLDGFRHDDLSSVPLQFATPPRFHNSESIAYAGTAPQVIVRSGRIRDHRDEIRAAYSTDGGKSWAAFASEPPNSDGGGHITVSADGKWVVWKPDKSGAWRTSDFGKQWQPVQGLPQPLDVEADRVDPRRFYAFDGASGSFYVSDDGGARFVAAKAGMQRADGGWFRPEIRPSPDAAGVVYLAAAGQGLLRWSAGKLEKLPGVEAAHSLGFGKAARGRKTSALFLAGRVGGRQGLFRSDDGGRSWARIDDDTHRYGRISHVTGDPRVYGRVYFAASGRGVIYGEPRAATSRSTPAAKTVE
ncbi:cellulase [Hydrocarboniphaga sp.]|uniref:cellulase n=1 Tax=Hydrocarboniphaga sp. TaxID=2033016 RepID=UPI003D0E1196